MLERARTNVVMLCNLSGVTLYPPHYSPLCDKQKQKNRMLTFDFSQPKPSKMVPGINSWYLYLKLKLVP